MIIVTNIGLFFDTQKFSTDFFLLFFRSTSEKYNISKVFSAFPFFFYRFVIDPFFLKIRFLSLFIHTGLHTKRLPFLLMNNLVMLDRLRFQA